MAEWEEDNQDESLWLREMVGEDLQPLFEDIECERHIEELIDRASWDRDLEERLIRALETSVEERNDDSSGSLWLAMILGEVGSREALRALIAAMASSWDESLQEAAAQALRRIGPPAVEAVMEFLEEDPDPEAVNYALVVLEGVGDCGDALLSERVHEFLQERTEDAIRGQGDRRIVEAYCLSSARLGNRNVLPALERILTERFDGRNPCVQDAIEMLEENRDGVPLVGPLRPWKERYRWLSGGETAPECPGGTEEDLDSIRRMYMGLNTPIKPPDRRKREKGRRKPPGPDAS